jgi:dTMP kinase
VSDPPRYPFIAIEGTDGSGKSTLRNLLHERLNDAGYGCFMVGQHSWLDLDAGRGSLAARTQQAGISRADVTAAYFTDKVLHQRHNINPALRSVAVLADRYLYSDAVYHEVLYGIPAEETIALHERQGSMWPDAVIFVDALPDVAFGRTVSRGMHRRAHETEPIIDRLHATYRQLFLGGRLAGHAVNLIHIDNNTSQPAEAAEQILPVLQELFPRPADRRTSEGVLAHGG